MRKPIPLAVSLACLALAACEKEGVSVRDEPHEMAQVSPPAAATGMPGMPKAQVGANETLWAGAIAAQDGQWVTFKTIAATDAIHAHEAALEGILKANDGSMPVGWTQEQATTKEAQFGRLYTLKSPAPEISVAVNQAGGSIALNVNRWRGQAGLDALSDDQAEAQVKKLDSGGKIWTVAIQGTAPAQDAPGTPGSKTAALTFTLPKDWAQVTPSSDMRLAQFSAGSGENACEVAITRFPGLIGGKMGSTLDNINRWRMQLKLAPWPAMPTQTEVVGMKIGGYPGAMMQIAATEGEEQAEKAMLVAFVADQDNTYFIKLTGNANAAQAQLMPMVDFLKSLKLPFTAPAAPLPSDLRLLPAIGK